MQLSNPILAQVSAWPTFELAWITAYSGELIAQICDEWSHLYRVTEKRMLENIQRAYVT